MKQKILYRCTKCAATFPKWAGQCSECGEWNSLEEYTPPFEAGKKSSAGTLPKKMLSTPHHTSPQTHRIPTGIGEFDRVMGGGFFYDSLVLLTGDPGIGKSTLSLQIAVEMAQRIPQKTTLIITGEESVSQVSDRLFRLSPTLPENLKILSETILESALVTMDQEDLGFVVVDSVQTLSSLDVSSGAGSLSQTAAVVEQMMRFAKSRGIPVLLIGHVTKTGEMAGPQTLAHLVDVTLHLEGDRFHEFRMLRSGKNRFGNAFELGVFKMSEKGLEEVSNPSEIFLEGRLPNAVGSAIFPSIEGQRAFLVEVQALTKWTNFGYPKRSASGVDVNRLGILLAVLARHADIKLDSEDVFANIVGGLRITEPALDMALIGAIISSKTKIPLPEKTLFIGEVGLSGEIRNVSHFEKRIKEGAKLGFTAAVVPKSSPKLSIPGISLLRVGTVRELKKMLESGVST